MKNLKHMIALILALCLVLCLCACTPGGNETTEGTGESTAQTTEPTSESTEPEETTEPVEDGNKTYTITLVDTDGNPMANTMVQLCLEACVPSMTNADGVATFNLPEADYYATVTVMPEGYTYSTDVEKFYFEDGSYDVTITLKAAE